MWLLYFYLKIIILSRYKWGFSSRRSQKALSIAGVSLRGREPPWASALVRGCFHISKQVHVDDMPSDSTWMAASRVVSSGVTKFIAQNHITDEFQS